jgi:hypothetical protein
MTSPDPNPRPPPQAPHLEAPRPAAESVEVRPLAAGHGVFALRTFRVGEAILAFAGRVVAAPNRRTLQLGDGEHLDIPAGLTDAESAAHYPWRFLNHGCAPNAALTGRTLVACTPISAGAEIVFNYNTTEWDMAEPFACLCGGPGCVGAPVRGLRHLSREEQERLRPFLSPYLRTRLPR